MAYFDDLRGPLDARRSLSARAVLVCGAGVFLALMWIAMVVSATDGGGWVSRPTLLGRQGYAHAWIFNTGLAIWGGTIFAVSVAYRDLRPMCRLGALLLGAGLVALAQWSPASLDGDRGGSQIEYRLHILYGVMALVGFALAAAGRGLAGGRRPDIFSLVTLYGVILGMAVLVFVPELGGAVEGGLAVLCLIWTCLRLTSGRTV